MNSKERKSGSGTMNLKKIQVNPYLHFQEEMINSKWKQTFQGM